MSENIKNPATEEEKVVEEKASLKLPPVEFPGQAKCLYISTLELADKIGSIFAPVFENYSGCKILINRNNAEDSTPIIAQTIPFGCLYVNLYFKEGVKNPGGIKNLTRRFETKSDDLGVRLENVLGGRSNRIYEVTEDTMDILTEFLPNPKSPRWDDRIVERGVQQSAFLPREEVVVCIYGLSLDALISKLYGRVFTEEDGTRTEFDYSIVPIKQVVSQREEYVLQITQLDRKIIRDLSRSLGVNLIQQPVNYNVYTG